MFNRDNAVGLVFLAACAMSAGIMLYYIAIGERPNIDFGPAGGTIAIIIFGAILVFGFLRSPLGRRLRGGRGERQWPDPAAGKKSPWERREDQ